MSATCERGDPHAPEHYPCLDGLRGLAALMVAFGHAGYFGWVRLVVGAATCGVILFFFLSGFMMAHHYLTDVPSGARRGGMLRYWGTFLARRFVRVYPPFLFAPVFGYLLLQPRLPPDFQRRLPIEGLTAFQELARIATLGGDLGIYWTIRVELFFYLIFPLIACLCIFARNRTKTLFLVCVVLMVLNRCPAGLEMVSWKISLPVQWPGYLSMFVAGAVTAAFAHDGRHGWMKRRLPWNTMASLGFAAFLIVVTLFSRLRPTQAFLWQYEWLFAGLFSVMFIGLIRSDGVLNRLLSSPMAVALGRTSYSLYLIHVISFCFVTSHLTPALHGMPAALVVLSFMCPGYYFLCERPFLRWSRNIACH